MTELDTNDPRHAENIARLNARRAELAQSPFSNAALGLLDINNEDVAKMDPDTWSIVGAAFRRENMVGSAISSETLAEALFPTEGAKSLAVEELSAKLQEDGLEAYADRFTRVRNGAEYEALKVQLEREREDREILAASGWTGFTAQMIAGTLDLPSLLPIGAGVAAARSGARAVVAVGAGAAGQATVSEFGLQATQETRTLQESALNVGGSMILGGLLGGASYKFIGPKKVEEVERRIELDWKDAAEGYPKKANLSAGALEAYRGSRDNFATGVDRVNALGSDAMIKHLNKMFGSQGHFLRNPLLDLMDSPSHVARDAVNKLVSNPWIAKSNVGDDGVTNPVNAEALSLTYQGRAGDWIVEAQRVYDQELKAGRMSIVDETGASRKMSEKDFAEAVYYAVITGEAKTPEIGRIAQAFTDNVTNPIKDKAVQYDLLPPGVSVDGSVNYAPRVYNRTVLREKREIILNKLEAAAEAALRRTDNAAVAAGEKPRFKTQEGLEKAAAQVASGQYDHMLGLGQHHIDFAPVGRNAAFKERTVEIDDKWLADNGFLVTDIFELGRRFSRGAGTEIALAESFAKTVKRRRKNPETNKRETVEVTITDPNLGHVIDDIKAEYQSKLDAATGKELERLQKEMQDIIQTFEDLRDVLRGRYDMGDPTAKSEAYRSMVNTAKNFNFSRLLGSMLASSLADPINIIASNGLGNTVKHGIVPALKSIRAEYKASSKEVQKRARLAGANLEIAFNSRLAAIANEDEVVVRNQTAIERKSEQFARWMGVATGMRAWNAALKDGAYGIFQARVLDNAAKGWKKMPAWEQAELRNLGIGEAELGRIKEAYDGQKAEKLLIDRPFAAHDEWGQEIGDIFRAAANATTRNVIVTPSAGDLPTFWKTPEGSMIFQFKSFLLANSARMVGRQLQLARVGDNSGAKKAAVYGGLMMIVSANVFIDGLKAALRDDLKDGDVGFDAWLKRAEEESGVVYDSLDRSGVLGPITEVLNMTSGVTSGRINARAGLQHLFGDEKKRIRGASRFRDRSPVDSALGPTLGAVNDVLDLSGEAASLLTDEDETFTRGDATKLRRLVPGQNLIWLRNILNWGVSEVGEAYGDWEPQKN